LNMQSLIRNTALLRNSWSVVSSPASLFSNRPRYATLEVNSVQPPKVGKNIKLEVYRYNGNSEEDKPYLQIYEINTADCGPMVLDALIHVKNTIDPSLTFRRSCREGICGSCSMNLGGSNGLACLKGIEEILVDNTLRIYPLPHMSVIRDLVVDMNKFYQQHKSIMPWLMLTPEQEAQRTEILQSPEDRKKLDGLYECILCACCSTSCPSYWWQGHDDYLGPAVLLQAFRWVQDSRDTQRSMRLRSLNQMKEMIWACHNILNCVKVCPKHLDPSRAIRILKSESLVDNIPLPKTITRALYSHY